MEHVYALGSQICQTSNKDNMLIFHQIHSNLNEIYTGNSGCYSQSYLCVNLIKKNRTHVILTQFACTTQTEVNIWVLFTKRSIYLSKTKTRVSVSERLTFT